MPTKRRAPNDFKSNAYELIKEYRAIPEQKSGVACGILTVRETWLLDHLVELHEKP